MIAEKALALAGPDAHLVRRPRACVAHVYVGPLTPSGRYVPRAGQTVCRAHTRRLSVLARWDSSLQHRPGGPRLVCARCSARLASQHRRAEQTPRTRAEFLRVHADTSKADVAFALELATTPAEVDAAAHVSLLLFEVAGCNTSHVDDRGREWPPLHSLVRKARGRVGGFPDTYLQELARHDELSAEARRTRARENKAAYADRLRSRLERTPSG